MRGKGEVHEAEAARGVHRGDDGLQQAAEAFAEEYTDNYVKTLLPLYNEDRQDSTKHAWYYYHYIINSHTQTGSKGTVVYIADINYREGGTHAVNQQVIMNFDAETGRQLTYTDIFVNGFEARLKSLLLKALKEKTGFNTVKALQANDYLTNTEIFVPENFILGHDAITFVYNPDEIAPYSVGSIELIIAYAAMESILNSTFEH